MLFATANTITVKNAAELAKANKQANPGDVIILQNGDWNNVSMTLSCAGTVENPITFKAETAGKVLITGNSNLKLGGSFIVVDGLNFSNGYAGDNAVINFRMNKTTVANNCRVTNCVINSFNNPKRMDENYWVSFSGKKNRIDHCTFLNKLNMGVLMAVTLEDDASRENFHSIDHNYFGVRLPLASNSGEIIRVGVSQHCQFNSNTQVTDNYFEHCDGETEIVSIKSGSNIVRNNLFKECQGGVVLRHGDNNTVENNIFLGNGKEGTGGVRIINAGQWVVNNLFYKCRGEGFRSPLSIMNGVPNSPANRYVPVTDAVVSNNSFVNCAPISLCEGSDTERSVAPDRVLFERNVFYNSRDSVIYHRYDDISGIHFTGNLTSQNLQQQLTTGFSKVLLVPQKTNNASIILTPKAAVSRPGDSLVKAAQGRISTNLSAIPGFWDARKLASVENNANKNSGSVWFKNAKKLTYRKAVTCKTWNDVAKAIEEVKDQPVFIMLTGNDYTIDQAISIGTDVIITSTQKKEIKFRSSAINDHVFEIKGGGSLSLDNLTMNLSVLREVTFITTDTSGSSSHGNFGMSNCSISHLKGTFFEAAKSSICDSIVIINNMYKNNKGKLFNFSNETDKKGYYNVEQLKFIGNSVVNHEDQIITMLRGGNDESTMGPLLVFRNNNISNSLCAGPQLSLYGTQKSFIEKNIFTDCNTRQTVILFEDAVRAVHLFRNNTLKNSGVVLTDKYVQSSNNKIL